MDHVIPARSFFPFQRFRSSTNLLTLNVRHGRSAPKGLATARNCEIPLTTCRLTAPYTSAPNPPYLITTAHIKKKKKNVPPNAWARACYIGIFTGNSGPAVPETLTPQ